MKPKYKPVFDGSQWQAVPHEDPVPYVSYGTPGDSVTVEEYLQQTENSSNIIKVTLTEGTKNDSGKAPMDLLSHKALEEIAKVFGFGAKKYGRFNYRNGMNFSRIIGAAYRHLGAFNSGEDLDPESGEKHIAHLGCCVIMLLDLIREKPEFDDRFKNETQGNKPPEDML